MESMHLATRLVIEQNMSTTTAFSARPDSPVRPVVERRRPTGAAWFRVRRLLPRRTPLHHAPA
ncbi:MAG: hypothetical protein CL424_08115 [Acidimicrobiaceae bacterium]|nr:hypothetical protein [Acidimicrobiaceae bacterium]